MASGKTARRKGHAFERYIAIRLRDIDPTAMRNVAECQQASVDINTKLPLAIQCKSVKSWRSNTPHSIWDQAATGARDPSHIPLGIVKITNKQPILCLIDLETVMSWLKKLYGQT